MSSTSACDDAGTEPVDRVRRPRRPPDRSPCRSSRRWTSRACTASARRSSQGLHSLGIDDLYDAADALPAPLRRPHERGADRRPGAGGGGDGHRSRLVGVRPPGPRRSGDGHRRSFATTAARCAAPSSTSRGASDSWPAPVRRSPCSARWSRSTASRQMTNPVVDLIGNRTGRVVAIYPLTREVTALDLGPGRLGRAGAAALRRTRASPTRCPTEVLDRLDLVHRDAAFAGIHAPESMGHMVVARQRLVFDELLRLQLALVQRKADMERTAIGHRPRGRCGSGPRSRRAAVVPGVVALRADRGAAAGDRRDHRRPGERRCRCTDCCRVTSVRARPWSPWRRCSSRCRAGTRACSWRRPRCWPSSTRPRCGPCWRAWSSTSPARCSASDPLQVALLTNRTRAAERRRVLAGLADGTIDLAIGTHALIQDGVEFHSLGVAVVDEQHRFGVEQRAALRATNADGGVPDLLVMTATPIPRTAAMTVYGDLDVSVLDELPPGRTPIRTWWARDELDEARRVAARARPGRSGSPCLRRVPAHRGVRQARGRLGRGDVRAVVVDRARRACASACCTGGCSPRTSSR